MEPAYEDLQRCIYTNDEELARFRQLVVNIVMATDIFDKDMTAIRNTRWNKAFHRDDSLAPLTPEEDSNLKATIVLEYLIQASVCLTWKEVCQFKCPPCLNAFSFLSF